MSHTTEAEYKKKQLEELRELHRQAVAESAQKAAEETQKVHDQLTLLAHNQKDLDDAEIAASTETAERQFRLRLLIRQYPKQICQMRLRSRKLYLLQIHQMCASGHYHRFATLF